MSKRNLKYYQKNSYIIKLKKRLKYKKDKKKILQERKEYYQNNTEKIIARVLLYRSNNKEKIADGHKVRYQRRKLKEAKILVSKLRWEIRNKAKRSAHQKDYYSKNKDCILEKKKLLGNAAQKKYRDNNKDKLAKRRREYYLRKKQEKLKETAENPH